MIDDNSLTAQDIRYKLVSFVSIRLTLHVTIKNMYFSLKNSLTFSNLRRFSCLSPTEYHILDMIDNNSLKIQDIRFKLVVFNSIRLTPEVYIKNIVTPGGGRSRHHWTK